MLTYLIRIINAALPLALLIGAAVAYAYSEYGKIGRYIAYGGIGAALIATLIRSFIANTSRYATWQYSIVYYAATVITFLVLAVATVAFSIRPIRRALGEKGMKVVNIVMPSLVTAFVAISIFALTSGVLYLPFSLINKSESFLSTEFLLSLLGIILAWAVLITACVGIEKLLMKKKKKGIKAIVKVAFFALCFPIIANVVMYDLKLLTPRRLIQPSSLNTKLLKFVVGIGDVDKWYTYAAVIICVIVFAVVVYIGLTKKEEYRNSAQKRRLKADWRTAFRRVVSVGVCLIVGVLSFTWFVELNTVKITEAPIEECEVRSYDFGENRYMSFKAISETDLTSADYVFMNDQKRWSQTTSLGANVYEFKVLVCDAEASSFKFQWIKAGSVIANSIYSEDKDNRGNMISSGSVELELQQVYSQKEDCLFVPITGVEDGHLHRFGYTTDAGYLTRFIVVRKGETNSYGVGLDACDICGEAGYYEKSGGQIVCKKCDVVMNVNTIGFKGGCNPIVIEFSVDYAAGYIIVPAAELIANELEFK